MSLPLLLPDSTPLHHNYTIPLVNQTQQFLTYGQPVFEKKLCVDQSRALVAIWIGINDISDSATYAVSFPDYYASIVGTMFELSVGPLFGAGYRHFLFLNLPPLDRTPANQARAASAKSPNATMVGWWSDALHAAVATFAEQNEGATMLVYDANTFLNGVLNEPGKYGITNTTDFCAGYENPDVLDDPGKYGCLVPLNQYFWLNSGHM